MKNITIFLILLTFLFACEETIEWEVDESIKKMVVDASLTNELKQHPVLLSKSRGFGEESTQMIQGASIELSDGTNTFNYVEDIQNPGLYYTENEIAGEIGITYTLDIELPYEISGYTNYSAEATMYPVFELDSVIASYEEETYDFFGYIETYVYCGVKISGTELETIGDRYIFKLRNNGVLLTDSLDELTFFLDDPSMNNFELVEELFFYEDTTEIKLNDTVTVEVHSVQDAFLDLLMYYPQAQYGGDPLGLSGPPANVPTNISNGGLGFFVVSAVSSKSAIVFDNRPDK